MLVEPIKWVLLYIKERSEKLFLLMIKIKQEEHVIAVEEIILILLRSIVENAANQVQRNRDAAVLYFVNQQL